MGSEWKTGSVGDAFDLINGFAFKSKEFIDDGIPVIKIKNVKAGFFSEHDFSYVAPTFLTEKPDKLARYDDLLISMSGNRHDGSPETWVGKVALFRKSNSYMINQRVGALRVKDPKAFDSRFMSYLLASWSYQSFFIAIATSSGGQANLSPKQILAAPIEYPGLGTQKAIAHILGSLDDKIELNRQLNATLEAMAQALFKSWFVDFDPVIDNALAAGNPIPETLQTRAKARKALGAQRKPLPAAIQKQFPSRFVITEEMGWVPEGWYLGCFNDIADHVRDNVKAEDVARYDFYVGLEHIGRKQLFLSDNGSVELIGSNKSKFEEKDLLFGKLRPYFHKVCLAPRDGICSTDIIVFRAKRKAMHSYMMLTAHTEEFVEYANMRSTGTRMPRASAKDMLDYPAVIPSQEILEHFETFISPIWSMGLEATEENLTLASLRDTLLPKLISGQLRIPEAEKLVADAV